MGDRAFRDENGSRSGRDSGESGVGEAMAVKHGGNPFWLNLRPFHRTLTQ